MQKAFELRREELCVGEAGLQAAGIDRHSGRRIEDRACPQEQEHTDEEVVDDANVEKHLQWQAWTAQKPHAQVSDAHMMPVSCQHCTAEEP